MFVYIVVLLVLLYLDTRFNDTDNMVTLEAIMGIRWAVELLNL